MDEPYVAELVGLLVEVTGEEPAAIGPHTRLDADLLLESVELARLNDLVVRRHGDGADIVRHVATLSLDELIELTVGDLARHVATHAGVPAR
ncbi:hypothetical protein GCM10009682_40290 [Luedemannella flava]|uniref:Acyl carrier protein n=1 Tax=Luedemannella flava TaxID=349316 RepID=A0ABN2M8V0_9ACTN